MNLRRATTASALLAAALSSIAAPGWSESLRIEGYYDYVELSLSLQLPDALTPGAANAAAVVAANGGPGVADSPVVLLSADSSLQVEGVDGCSLPTVPQRTCALPAIAPKSSQAASLLLQPGPFARGSVVFGAAVSSEAIESNPGDEMAVVALPLIAEADTRVAFVDRTPQALVDGRLVWSIRVDNDGPSAAISPTVYNASWAVGGPVDSACITEGAASCYNQLNYLGPGSSWLVRLIAPPLSRANPEIQVGFGVTAQELQSNYGNDGVWLVYRDGFFSDDFE